MTGTAPLRIGVLGASTSGWAHAAHMPALAILPEARVTAVSTTSLESARRAAASFGAAHAFADARDLAACPEVDLVAVSIKAPGHLEAVLAAVAAGKHVFCEWPMGASLADAERMTAAVATAGVIGFPGLQARAAAEMQHARALIADGYVGRVFAANIYGAHGYWADPLSSAYSADAANGANVLTIAGGHGLDVACWILGDAPAHVSGRLTNLRPTVMAADIQRRVPMTAPDQFAMTGSLRSGAVLAAHIVGMAGGAACYRLHITGDEGELLVEGAGMAQNTPMRLSGARGHDATRTPIAVPEDPDATHGALPAGPARNVGRLWRQIVRDLRTGAREAPRFADGLRSRALIDAIAVSHAAGGSAVAVRAATAP